MLQNLFAVLSVQTVRMDVKYTLQFCNTLKNYVNSKIGCAVDTKFWFYRFLILTAVQMTERINTLM